MLLKIKQFFKHHRKTRINSLNFKVHRYFFSIQFFVHFGLITKYLNCSLQLQHQNPHFVILFVSKNLWYPVCLCKLVLKSVGLPDWKVAAAWVPEVCSYPSAISGGRAFKMFPITYLLNRYSVTRLFKLLFRFINTSHLFSKFTNYRIFRTFPRVLNDIQKCW